MSPAVKTPAPLGRVLVELRKITEAQLEEALQEQARTGGERLGEILLRQELVTEDDLLECLASQYSLPMVKLNRFLVDHAIFDVFPQRFLEKNVVCPMFRVEDTTTVAISDPTNIFVLDEIRRLVGGRVQEVLATASNIQDAIRNRADINDAFGIDDIVDEVEDKDVQIVEERSDDLDNIAEVSELSPVVRLVNFVIFKAIQESASDIHIEVDESELRVRHRVDGVLHQVMTPPRSLHAAVVSRIKVMANLDISERRLPQDGRVRVVFERRPVDLRVSTLPCANGEKVVIRILDKDSMMLDLEAIGVGRDMLEVLDQQIRRPNGMILVTGPTGSGKSTTLYSVLQRIKAPGLNLCTVEDPVEFNVKGVNQVQANAKIGLTFANALRSLLRQDPDVIMVGEIRDKETAAMAVQASLTGHLVLSTLHTNDAPSAITRLVNMEIEPYLLGASLQGVLAQRLVRKICSECREASPATARSGERLKRMGFDVERLYRGAGCASCRDTGYAGRIGIFELLTFDDELRDLVVGGGDLQSIRRHAAKQGIRRLLDDGIAKTHEGITSADEVLRVTE
ncbi:MAG: GspE/PulE family protein [Planctomycetota bacterium JB042]